MRFRLPLLLALACATPAIAGDSIYTKTLESVLTLRVDGEIEIDANGRVLSHKLDTELPDAMTALVDKAIARWKFAPPTEDGKPLERARSKMRIALVANEVEQDGKTGLVVKIDNVTFPPPQADPGKPAPPGPVMHVGRLPTLTIAAEAVITFHVQYDASGRILDVAPSQCTVLAIDPGALSAERACQKLERDSVSAMRKWKVAEVKADMEKPETGTFALEFMWNRDAFKERATATGQWRRELRSPYRPAPWEPTSPRVGTSDVDGTGLVARTAGLTLLEGIGKTL